MPLEDIEDAIMQDTGHPEQMGISQMNEEGKIVIGGKKKTNRKGAAGASG